MYLIFDIGGTSMRLALSHTGKDIDQVKVVSTPQSFNAGMVIFEKTFSTLTKGKKVSAVCGAVPGVLNKNKTKLVISPNLSTWEGKDLQAKLSSITKSKVRLENDAALGALGEVHFGVNQKQKVVAYLTLSTGIGGCLVARGEVSQPAEPGHQILIIDNKVYYFEQLASGEAMNKRHKKIPSQITNQKAWILENKYLAYGLHNLIIFWQPDVIIIDGGVGRNSKIKIGEIKKYLQKTLDRYATMPEIKKTTLQGNSGLYGALYLVTKK